MEYCLYYKKFKMYLHRATDKHAKYNEYFEDIHKLLLELIKIEGIKNNMQDKICNFRLQNSININNNESLNVSVCLTYTEGISILTDEKTLCNAIKRSHNGGLKQ